MYLVYECDHIHDINEHIFRIWDINTLKLY